MRELYGVPTQHRLCDDKEQRDCVVQQHHAWFGFGFGFGFGSGSGFGCGFGLEQQHDALACGAAEQQDAQQVDGRLEVEARLQREVGPRVKVSAG